MKKSLIYWIISAVIIVVGAVFLISSGFNANTDLADGTQIEVAFGEVVDSAKFEEIRSELVNKFRAAGYSVDYGTMLKDVNAITGVRFTISEDGITEENVVSVIGSSYEVEVNAVNFYGETPTGAFIIAFAVTLVLVAGYIFLRSKGARVASMLTFVIITLVNMAMVIAIRVIMSALLGFATGFAFYAALAATLAASAVVSVVVLKSLREGVRDFGRIILVLALVALIGSVVTVIFVGSVYAVLPVFMGAFVTLFTAFQMTGGLFEALTAKKN